MTQFQTQTTAPNRQRAHIVDRACWENVADLNLSPESDPTVGLGLEKLFTSSEEVRAERILQTEMPELDEEGIETTAAIPIRDAVAQYLFEIGSSTFSNSYESEGWLGKLSSLPLGGEPFPANLNNRIGVYPNPTRGLLHLTSEPSTTRSLPVRDPFGRTVAGWHRTATGVDLSAIATGCYVIECVTLEGTVWHGRIVKE